MQQNTRKDLHAFQILHFIDDIFEPFFRQSRNIDIRYVYQVREPSAEFFGEIAIFSVNGFSTPDEFRNHLSKLLYDSLQMFFVSLQQQKDTNFTPFIEYVRTKLQSLSSAVIDEKIILPDKSGKCSLHHKFKSFADCRLSGPGNSDYSIFNQGIRYKAEKFVLTWLEVLDDAIKQLDLIHDLLNEAVKLPLPQPDQATHAEKTFTPKFNLSVSQLGYFLNLLVRTGTLDLPPRQVTMFIKWASENFQSRNQESIQPASLRNKYSVHDFAAQDHIEEKLEEILAMIRHDREKLSR